MKIYSIPILTALFLVLAASCKKDDPDPLAQRLNELSATWRLGSVENDNVDVTDQFEGFKLSITDKNYTTTAGLNPWPASGTYEIKTADLNTILRSDGTAITINEVTANTLVLSFNYTSLSGGRIRGVTGNFTFSLIK